MSKQLICVGVISSAYHLQGLVKITSFTADPQNICRLPCIRHSGEAIICNFVKSDKGKMICRIDGINTRTDAEKILGTKLYVSRADLPELDESEFYIEDLVGLDVIDTDDKIIGQILAVHNFGAGEIIEVSFKEKKSEMYSFTKEIFPEITKNYIRLIDIESDE